jgi:hypothetical protein
VPLFGFSSFGFLWIAIGWLFYTVWRCEDEYPYIYQDIPRRLKQAVATLQNTRREGFWLKGPIGWGE